MGYWKARLRRLYADEGGWVQLIPIAASLIGGWMASKKAKNDARKATGGASLQNLVPQIMQLIQQQQGQQSQDYGLRMQRYQANQPMQDAIRKMAMGLMPAHLQQPMTPMAGASLPTQPTQPATAQPRPVSDRQRRRVG